jgi:hypothetical protein
MSDSENEQPEPDEELVPEDLRPGEENPLAEPLPDDVEPDDLDMAGGKTADESDEDDEDDREDGDRDSDG